MPDDPGKFYQFWQELRRRKVIRVISVYAAAAFVILELADIVAPSLGLPAWTVNFIIILLCVGFVITVILSWIFDIQPGGGMIKTEPADQDSTGRKPAEARGWKIASYLSLVVIAVLIILNVIPDKENSGEIEVLDKSIAVLPFQNLSEEEGNEHFVDGLVEDLLNRLSVIVEMKVISRTSSDMYRERGKKSVPEIARELNVAYIVEGSVQRYGDKARVTVQLINAHTDHHLWAKNYDRDLVDVFQTQSEIAMKIASELQAVLNSRQETQIHKIRTSSIAAFEYYNLGRFYWEKRTGDGFRKSLEYFEKAIQEDPKYGLAYAGLADSYQLMAIQGWINNREGRDKAVELANRALELDENLAEAYTVLASVGDYLDLDWEAARRAYQKALELNPNYSTALQYYSEHLAILGIFYQARMEMQKAIELDPMSFVKRYASAKLYCFQGEMEASLKEIELASNMQPDHYWVPRTRMYCYWYMNETELAHQELKKFYSAQFGKDFPVSDSIYHTDGLSAVFERIAELEKSEFSYLKAIFFAMAGRDEEALNWLEISYQKNSIADISWHIAFYRLHQDPRFLAILKKMGLDKYPIYGQQIPDYLGPE